MSLDSVTSLDMVTTRWGQEHAIHDSIPTANLLEKASRVRTPPSALFTLPRQLAECLEDPSKDILFEFGAKHGPS